MNTGEAISLPLAVSVILVDGSNLLPTVDGAMIVLSRLRSAELEILREMPPPWLLFGISTV